MKVSNWLVERGVDVFVEDGAFRTRSDNTRQDFAKIKAKTRPYNTGDRLGQVKKFESWKIRKEFFDRKSDLILSLGGDGTLLHVSKKFPGNMPPVVPFNFGTFGFLIRIRKKS